MCPVPSELGLFYRCPLALACKGGNFSHQCNTDIGFSSSPLCGTCRSGFVISKLGCVECPVDSIGVVLFVGLFCGFVLWVWLGMSSFNKNLHFVAENECEDDVKADVIQRVALSYISTLCAIGDLKSRGPALLRQLMGMAAPLSSGLNMGFYPVKCALGLTFYQQTLGTALVPVMVVIIFCLLEAVHVAVQRMHLRTMLPNVMKCMVFIMFLSYPTITKVKLAALHHFSIHTVSTCLFHPYSFFLPAHHHQGEASSRLWQTRSFYLPFSSIQFLPPLRVPRHC